VISKYKLFLIQYATIIKLFILAGKTKHSLIHTFPIHIDIKNDKIWLQWNGTERDFAEELVALGV